ncbi:hypothetical protein LGT39_01535 [Demequina sp. TTPB684]|uniref:DUF6994 family protein n=1 Tax=unclassified Demequina TaxID=2620311 RepID=UPI001CF1DA09|nr:MULTISPECIES: hypothetical protein [unclassified Demequina]MCB2411530.1 hypothetical protein [Demequina sp. TTPB684]UPU88084.1 hypothetical protein LGT36_012670 [Demequina sp. TMPB413]
MAEAGLEPIDTTFDVRTDTPAGKDPDSHSPTLRRYHQLLWSKPLPDGTPFTLTTATKSRYLHHASARGEFTLTSDSVIHSYRTWSRTAPIINQVSADELDEFQRLGYTIGGMMVFPGTRVPGVHTINGERGLNPAIADRMDLTLECIRLHYASGTSPMSRTLEAYGDFFALFEDFVGYVDFFLLQDLLDDDGMVTFFLPFTGFDANPLPATVSGYLAYRDASLAFVRARNARIDAWQSQRLET